MTTLTGDEGNNTLIGGSDDDVFLGLGGDDILLGNGGWDLFYGDAGNDTIDGQGDTDTVSYSAAPAGVTVNLTTGIASDGYGGTDTLRSIEQVHGTRFNDSLTGTAQDNYFWGEGGNDLIDGLGGNDWVNYVTGRAGVTVNLTTGVAKDGSGGTSTLRNIENVYGTDFDDNLTGNEQGNRLDGLGGSNLIDGRGGYDTVYYCAESTGVTVNLTTGKAIHDGATATDTLISIERVYASGFDDNLTGSAENNYFWGNGGNDTFSGLAGNDSLDGGSEIDTACYGIYSGHILAKTASGWTVKSSADGTDTLDSIERLQFSDKKIALDLTPDGNAGQAMEFIGAVAPDLLNNTTIRGAIISLFDQGYTMESLSQWVLDQKILPSTSNADLANAVYHNVIGGTAPQDTTNGLVGYIDAYGQANFLATVAGLHINVDLVGLQQTGVEYVI